MSLRIVLRFDEMSLRISWALEIMKKGELGEEMGAGSWVLR